jgi:hypothetical protein
MLDRQYAQRGDSMAKQMARERTSRAPMNRWMQHGACLGLMAIVFVACATGQGLVTVGTSRAAVERAAEIAMNQATTSPENLPTIAAETR